MSETDNVGGKAVDEKSHPDGHQIAEEHDFLVVTAPPTNIEGQDDPGNFNSKPEPSNWIDKWTFYVLVLAFFTACYAGYEAHRLANLTADTLTEAHQSFVVAQRAVIVPDVRIQQMPSGDPTLWVVPTFTNAGSTQTKEMWGTVILAPVPVKTDRGGNNIVPTLLDAKTATHNRFWLGPKQSFQYLGLSQPLNPWLLAMYKPGKDWLVYQVLIQYRDIFPGTPIHTQRFCYAIWNNPAITGVGGYSVSQCGGNANCSDDECKAE